MTGSGVFKSFQLIRVGMVPVVPNAQNVPVVEEAMAQRTQAFRA
jgi:hypothetical protein